MRSVILCEGQDDLWFIAYYLNKTRGWEKVKRKTVYPNYAIPESSHQKVIYLSNGTDGTAIWAVGGKDCFDNAINDVKAPMKEYPDDSPESLVVLRDSDDEKKECILADMKTWFDFRSELSNYSHTPFSFHTEEKNLTVSFTPIIIPQNEPGAIETLLVRALEERDEECACIAEHAREYVSKIKGAEKVHSFLSHDRLTTKAELSAVIAIINPDHSTCQFQDIMHLSKWEENPKVQSIFEAISEAVTK